jgi:hypothetical protein
MDSEPEKTSSWLDEITDLIRRKKEENMALRKVQESLKSIGKVKNGIDQPKTDDEMPPHKSNEDQSVKNENND